MEWKRVEWARVAVAEGRNEALYQIKESTNELVYSGRKGFTVLGAFESMEAAKRFAESHNGD